MNVTVQYVDIIVHDVTVIRCIDMKRYVNICRYNFHIIESEGHMEKDCKT